MEENSRLMAGNEFVPVSHKAHPQASVSREGGESLRGKPASCLALETRHICTGWCPQQGSRTEEVSNYCFQSSRTKSSACWSVRKRCCFLAASRCSHRQERSCLVSAICLLQGKASAARHAAPSRRWDSKLPAPPPLHFSHPLVP